MKRSNGIILFLALLLVHPLRSQEIPAEVTIAWDASRSMEDRDFALDRAYLDDYFAEHQNILVTLQPFSNGVWPSEQFRVESGEWKQLENRLESIQYDGATAYMDLPAYCQGSEVLLFTDGKQNLATVTPIFSGHLIIVNSSGTFDKASLNLLAIMNEGELANIKGGPAVPARKGQPYYGTVYGAAGGQAVQIRVAGDNTPVIEPAGDGTYAIEAQPGDVLEFIVNGRPSASKPLGDNRHLDVWLEDTGEIRLDEVVVTVKAAGEEEVLATAMGNKNADGVGYAVQSIDENQIADVNTTVSTAAQGKFSGVQLGQNDDLSQVQIRPKTSILSNNYGLIVIDGVPMPKSNSSYFSAGSPLQNTDYLDPKNIASITVLKSLAATNRYGSMGANGAILITTKTATVGRAVKRKDMALLTNNIYEGEIEARNKALTTPYILELKAGKNVAEAYDIYLGQREKYQGQPSFYLDIADYFREASPVLASRILSNILELEHPSISSLNGLLYKARELGDLPLEMQTANRFLEAFPGNIQSYLNFAMARKHSGNYQEALNMLLAIEDGTANKELDFSGLSKTVGRELRNLVSQHQAALELGKVPQEYKNNVRFNARLIFEWSKPDAQFSLQFVNPQKRFFTWEHNMQENGQRMREEAEKGFSLEEFEIFGEGVTGNWILNATYEGNVDPSDTAPVFVLCRVEKNFGKPGQTADFFLIRLEEHGSKQQIARLKIE